jgi:polyribonucleotide nucleotidyltransferase
MKVALARPRKAACTSWARWPRRLNTARGDVSTAQCPAHHHVINIPKDKIRDVIGSQAAR